MIRKLRLRRETIRTLANNILRRVQAGFVACSDTCGICDPPQSPAQSCMGCTND